jgi:hypothetical protein
MEYHRRTLEMIGRWPASVSSQGIDAAAARLGLPIPEAVKQWYSVDGTVEILGSYSNCDYPTSPDDFAIECANDRSVIAFLSENQGVCSWAFVLNGSEDPSVMINLNPPDENAWRDCAEHFSSFVFCRVFDHIHWYDDLMYGEIYGPLTDRDLAFLRDRFTEEPMTRNRADSPTYRFSEGERRIVIWTMEGQSDWYVSSNTQADLKELKGILQPLWQQS